MSTLSISEPLNEVRLKPCVCGAVAEIWREDETFECPRTDKGEETWTRSRHYIKCTACGANYRHVEADTVVRVWNDQDKPVRYDYFGNVIILGFSIAFERSLFQSSYPFADGKYAERASWRFHFSPFWRSWKQQRINELVLFRFKFGRRDSADKVIPEGKNSSMSYRDVNLSIRPFFWWKILRDRYDDWYYRVIEEYT